MESEKKGNKESTCVLIVLKDGSVNKFGNVKAETFYDNAGGFYSVTSQFNEMYIFPINSINYMKVWLSKEEDNGK